MSAKKDTESERHVAKTAVDYQRKLIEKLKKNPEKNYYTELNDGQVFKVYEPPVIVRNVQASTSAVGSGDYHTYRNLRRNEYFRTVIREENRKKEEFTLEFLKKEMENHLRDEEKTNKLRQKRLRKKENKKKREKAGKMTASNSEKNDTHQSDINNNDNTANESSDSELMRKLKELEPNM